jgi:hypothetical protein
LPTGAGAQKEAKALRFMEDFNVEHRWPPEMSERATSHSLLIKAAGRRADVDE